MVKPPCQIHLEGDLGAGKTTLVRGFIQGLGYSGAVKSPTYTLIEPYEFMDKIVYHLDLYRLADGEELEYLGVRELSDENAISLIEWPQNGQGYLPAVDLLLALRVIGSKREIGMTPVSSTGAAIVDKLQNDSSL